MTMNSQQVSEDNNTRLIRLEIEQAHIREDLNETKDLVKEMHDVFLKARGMQWLFLAFFVVAGFLLAQAQAVLSLFGWKTGN